MTPALIDAAIISISASVGITSGWWLKRLGAQRDAEEAETLRAQQEAARREEEEKHKAQTKEMVAQLQVLAQSVAAQVGEHSTRVQEINSELTADGQNSDEVMAAINRLVEANQKMQEQLSSAERKLEEKSREIEEHVTEARTDALTQINNRRAFDEEMTRCLIEFRDRGRPSCVMMIDVDFFKKFNDTHGHKAGDEVLRYVASTLKSAVANTDVPCRYGGEEFAIIFPGSTLANAKAAAERARAAIGAMAIEFEGKSLRVTASAGLSEFTANESIEQLLKRSDDALYVSKKAGRDCGHLHDGREFIPFIPRPKAAPVEPPPPPKAPEPVAIETNPAAPACDPMSGLSNRAAFYDDVNRRVAHWRRGGEPMSILAMKIDALDELLRRFGKHSLPLIVKASTQFLKATLRDMDHVSRYDEDTFAVLLPTAALNDAATIADRLRRAVERCRLPYLQQQITFTVSFGVAEAVQGDGTSRLIQRAVSAMNTAANQGGNRICVHTGDHAVSPGSPQPV